MKRGNEFAVGLAVLGSLAVVVAGALWLSQTDINNRAVAHVAQALNGQGLAYRLYTKEWKD